MFPKIKTNIGVNTLDNTKSERERTFLLAVNSNPSQVCKVKELVRSRLVSNQQAQKQSVNVKRITRRPKSTRVKQLHKRGELNNDIKPWEYRPIDGDLDRDFVTYIYNYRLPSSLHCADMEPEEDDSEAEECAPVFRPHQYLRPRVDASLLDSMAEVETELLHERSVGEHPCNETGSYEDLLKYVTGTVRSQRKVRFQNDDTASGGTPMYQPTLGTETESTSPCLPRLKYSTLNLSSSDRRTPFDSSILGMQFKSNGQSR